MRILALDIPVYFSDTLYKHGAWGVAAETSEGIEISLYSKQPLELLRRTVWEEAIHVGLDICGYGSESSNENLVKAITNIIDSVLLDNAWVKEMYGDIENG